MAAVCVLVCGAILGSGALAQAIDDPDAALPVRERPRPGYDPVGVRLGSFIFYPSLTAAPFHDSNVFAAPDNAVGDSGILLSPRLSTASQFSRHALDVEIGADRHRYRRQRSEDRTDLFARANGRVDIHSEMVALLRLEAALRHEDRGSANSPALAAEPVPVKRLAAAATLNKTFNRFALSLGTAATWADYDDVRRIGGGTIDQDFRDHIIYSVGGRGSYAWSPGHRIFADLRANRRDYDNPGLVPLGSRGVTALAGLELALTALLHGELGLGYLRQEFDSPLVPDIEGPSYLANLVWNATPLMTVTVSGERQVEEGIVPGAVGRIDSSFQVVLDYELLRNLIISPRLRFVQEDYSGIARTDRVIQPGLKIDYLVNRYLALGGEYTFTTRESNATEADFVRHQARIHAKAQF